MRLASRWWLLLVLAALGTGTTTAAAASRPDIQTVTVSRDRAGTLRFAIGFSDDISVGNTRLEVMLDTDKDSRTGIQGGEYALDYSSDAGDESPSAVLLTAHRSSATEGDADVSRPTSLQFSSTPRTALFRIAAADIGAPSSFGFWVFIEQNGKLVDTAPTHVVVSSPSKPWTYPKGAVPAAGAAYPVERYEDTSDTSLSETEIPWRLILLGVIGLGAVLGIGGYTYDRLRKGPASR